jgi:putative pyoverdin transport system ATP-binding/permease protein
MNLVRLLFRTSGALLCLAALVGLLSGLCSAALIALIDTVLNSAGEVAPALGWAFAGVAAAKLATQAGSQAILARLAVRTVTRLRRDLSRKLLAAPLRELEELGPARVLVVLTEDLVALGNTLPILPNMVVHAAVLLGCAAYLAWLSWPLFGAVLGLTLLGTGVFRVLQVRTRQALRSARKQEDVLVGHYRALTEGVKELKLNRGRREGFLAKDVYGTTRTILDRTVAASNGYVLMEFWTHLLFFALLGLVVFALPGLLGLGVPTLTGYVLVLLFMMRPMVAITSTLPYLGVASVALHKVEELDRDLTQAAREPWCEPDAGDHRSWQCLEYLGVTYHYGGERNDHFTLGPLDLTLRPGEVVFLIGGNGSGKSTLAKLATGLYPPASGEVRLDGEVVTDENRDAFRQLFSAVFSDFYLFETLHAPPTDDLDARARDYLARLELTHKVRVTDGAFSTTALSQGQRKRLALLAAYLEDRPVYVFDEWASNQDPEFRDVFYVRLLPELKARGKAVLVISHDDRYFGVADRLLLMEDGRFRGQGGGAGPGRFVPPPNGLSPPGAGELGSPRPRPGGTPEPPAPPAAGPLAVRRPFP